MNFIILNILFEYLVCLVLLLIWKYDGVGIVGF